MNTKSSFSVVVAAACLAAITVILFGQGSLEPPASDLAPTLKTLQQIEPRILLDQQSRVAACGARVTARDAAMTRPT